MQLLYDTICRCINMAVDQKMLSIAFPAVGCGKLGYDHAAVSDCFVRAEKDTGALIKVHVLLP